MGIRRLMAMLATTIATPMLLATPAWGQEGEEPGLEISPPTGNGGRIIPRPELGSGPETPGDPGGWQQLLLLGVILVGVVLIGVLVRRQIANARRLNELT